MKQSKPWYQSITLWSAVLTLLGVLLERYQAGETLLDASTQAQLGEILSYVGIGGVMWGRTRAKTALRVNGKAAGFSRLGALVVAFLVGLLLTLGSGCGHSFTGKTSGTRVAPNGTGGTKATLLVDGSEVCKVIGEMSSVKVHVNIARRICKAWAPQCTWKEQ